ASGLLAYTFDVTKPLIEQREEEDRQKALRSVFFLQTGDSLVSKDLGGGVTALYRSEKEERPVYFAVSGEGGGYNSSVPVTLMVGFTGPGDDAGKLLHGYVAEDKLPPAGQKGRFIVGFSVIKSEETPGLGEKVKDVRPPFTWAQYFSGNRPPESPDKATAFQVQFRGREAAGLKLKKQGGDLDAITASTITSTGVLAAIRDAEAKLARALPASPR
ncbi:MAG: FMN-binding protein, partial [Planctomycetota bacterium]|nr:FMN-binding protein [Planctomycetota bacterium]